MDMRLEMKQSQLLTMAMQTSLQLLKMNNLELNAYLKELSCSNAMVDLQYPEVSYRPSPFARDRVPRRSPVFDGEGSAREELMQDKASEISALQDLYLQAAAMNLPFKMDQLLRYLIDSLDENGFLPDSAEDLSAALQVPLPKLNRAIALLQSMEPAGIGASDALHCLLQQLDRSHPEEAIAKEILLGCTDLLAAGKYSSIAKKLHSTEGQIRHACEIIRSLNPKPLNGMGGTASTQYILPDFYVLEEDSSRLSIQMNDYYLPKLQINQQYYHLLQEETLPQKDSAFLKNNYQQANEVLRFLSYRTSTLQKVAQYLVSRQPDFFLLGPGHRRTLSNRDVAEALDLHESTVSRAVSGKYFECKWGIFPMKELFCHSLSTGEHPSSMEYDQILRILQSLIQSEPDQNAYSDQRLSELMHQQGIEISRRTVVKYRQQLGIPSSTERNARKRLK